MESEVSFPARMQELGEGMSTLLKKYQPQQVSIEKIFLGRNADSAFKLGHARGVAMYESAKNGAEIFEYATRIVKKGIVGSGAATKEQVQTALMRLLGLQAIHKMDASDALALGVFHAYQILNPLHQRLHSQASPGEANQL